MIGSILCRVMKESGSDLIHKTNCRAITKFKLYVDLLLPFSFSKAVISFHMHKGFCVPVCKYSLRFGFVASLCQHEHKVP